MIIMVPVLSLEKELIVDLKIKSAVGLAVLCLLVGCATSPSGSRMDADHSARMFFEDLRNSHEQEAYELFSDELSLRISFDQFQQLIETLESRWGKPQSEETVVMPFHVRSGESELLPSNISGEQIKRYVFEVKFDNATVNCGMTIVSLEDQYRIAWFSFWGSDIYMTSEIREKIKELFEGH